MPSPSMSVRPITLRPVSPPGSTRLSSGSTLTPLSWRSAICCPIDDVDLALDVDEPLVLGDQRRVQVGLLLVGEAEHGGQRADRAFGVGDELRVDADRGGRDRDRQLLAVAIEDRAAVGVELDLSRPLVGAGLAQRLAADRLQASDPEQHVAEHHQHHHQQADQPAPRLAEREPVDPLPPAARARRRGA